MRSAERCTLRLEDRIHAERLPDLAGVPVRILERCIAMSIASRIGTAPRSGLIRKSPADRARWHGP
jgi:hypothetical protein